MLSTSLARMRELVPLLLLSFVASPAVGQEVQRDLSAIDVFQAAAQAQAEGRTAEAIAFYVALESDADIEVRTEARFRKGMLLATTGRLSDAAVTFRAILDEKPDATRVRLELARILVQMGDEAGARRALRHAQAQGLPDDVAVVVDQFAAALRSTKRTGGSLELSLAPDSNINRATSARTLDTVIAPLTLSEDARARSGIGLQASAQAYTRVPISSTLTFLPRASARGVLYRESQFNDVSFSALAGVELRSGRDRLTSSVGRAWRWYGGDLYATTDLLAMNWIHPLGRRAQLTLGGTAGQADYKSNPLQSGELFDVSANGEYALSPRSGIGLGLGATRQNARDPGYATTAGSVTALGWWDIGQTTFFASSVLRRTEGDARLALFSDRRREWLVQLNAGATFRQLTVEGFAPVVRVGFERNASTVGLYDYKRVTTEIGITRAF